MRPDPVSPAPRDGAVDDANDLRAALDALAARWEERPKPPDLTGMAPELAHHLGRMAGAALGARRACANELRAALAAAARAGRNPQSDA